MISHIFIFYQMLKVYFVWIPAYAGMTSHF